MKAASGAVCKLTLGNKVGVPKNSSSRYSALEMLLKQIRVSVYIVHIKYLEGMASRKNICYQLSSGSDLINLHIEKQNTDLDRH